MAETNLVPTTFKIPRSDKQRIRVAAALLGLTMSELIRQAATARATEILQAGLEGCPIDLAKDHAAATEAGR